MSARIDYGQVAERLDYPTVEKKLKQLAERKPTRKRKTAADVLEPLREQLLTLHRKGWSSSQLVNELKASGVPVSPARFRECLSRWASNGKSRPSRRKVSGSVTAQPSVPASQVAQSKSASAAGQPGFKLTQP
ncbi:MAG: hypothetical protein M9920_00570 [Verrucomicrobiae bacterium]|nr:hypothetical protein [Verrucomicrobiae bacterium]